MTMSNPEKISIALLCDLHKPQAKRELDPDFIATAVADDDLWAIDWRYSGIGLKISTPPEVAEVCDILEMWTNLERSFAALDPAAQDRIRADRDAGPDVRFAGFDANNEKAYHIARVLIEDLDRWTQFKSHSLNSHMPVIDMYLRQLSAFKPIWKSKLGGHGGYDLSETQITSIVRERIHPQYRDTAADGTWTRRT